jgi:uncharacterized protein
MNDIAKIKQFAIDTARQTEHHGLKHWENVERFGRILAKRTGANLLVVQAFAYLHDIGRCDDGIALDHGKRSAELVRENSHLIDFLNSHERDQLLYAIENHTNVKSSNDVTINTCWDSDRLDLTRIGIAPNPYLMASDAGHHFAKNPDELQVENDNLTGNK